ncbi:MAG: hypothetical protein JNL17_10450 [Cyclobacteriaceae bacterium]|nr:hypothetical protein [Cyclobacteriaceae bacterium]
MKHFLSFRLVFGVCLFISLAALFFDKEIGVNLLTELGGVALTVFIIDGIIERRERQKRISIDQRILSELQFIIASYYSIWKHLYWPYLPAEKITNASDLVRVYPTLVTTANITHRFDTVSINHPESWDLFFYNRTIGECFKNYHEAVTKGIKTFINDFKIYIEPELLDILLSLLESQYFKDLVLMHQETTPALFRDVLNQDPDKLESYLKPSSVKNIEQITILEEYSERLNKVILRFKTHDVPLYRIETYFLHPTQQFSETPTLGLRDLVSR